MTLQIGEDTQQRSQNYSLIAEDGFTVSKLHEMLATPKETSNARSGERHVHTSLTQDTRPPSRV